MIERNRNSPWLRSRLKAWGLGLLIMVVVANSLFPYLWILISSVKPTNIMYATPTVWFFKIGRASCRERV